MKRLTKKQREVLREMFGGLCAYCGKPLGDRWHADHVEPVYRKWWAETGEMLRPENDNFENLFPACAPCNIDKSVLSLESWRGKLQQSCRVLTDHHSTYRHAKRFGLVVETNANVVFHFEAVRSRGAA